MLKAIKGLYDDAVSIYKRDPAARNVLEVILLYPGFHVLFSHRICNYLYRCGLRFIPRLLSQIARHLTGIEIHPGATIGKRLFIDHGMGIVIGETAEVGDDCLIYHGATLGGTGKDLVKRHPMLGNNVMVGAGSKILGPIHIADNVKIGAGAVVVKECLVNGVTIVGTKGEVIEKSNNL